MKSKSQIFMETVAWASGSIALILGVLYLKFQNELILNCTIVLTTICYHFTVRIINGDIVPRFKNKLNYKSYWFKSKKFEDKLYKILKVKQWKDKMPTYVPDEFDLEKHSLEEIVQDMCNAELVHETNAVLSLFPAIFSLIITDDVIWIFLLVISSIISSLADFIFVIIQRFNRPRVSKLIERKNKIKMSE